MAVMIGHAAIDEHGVITGGQPGDQTGKEVCTREWYDFGYTQVLRPKDDALRHFIGANMEAACRNEKIGYDQSQRNTLYTELRARAWNMNAVDVACECDCSSLVACCVNASGVTVSPSITTRNEAQALLATGRFEQLTDRKYFGSSDHLKRGDILIRPGQHTVIVLTDGPGDPAPAPVQQAPSVDKVEDAMYHDKSMAGSYKVTTALNLRRGAGSGYKVVAVLPKGAVVRNYGYYNKVGSVPWLYVQYGEKSGYCSAKYLKRT